MEPLTMEGKMKTITREVKAGSKVWIARITGTSAQYGMERKFQHADERKLSSNRKWETFTWCLDDGLYEVRGGHKGENDGYKIVCKGGTVYLATTPERAKAIAQMMQDGVTFDAAREATKPAPVAAK